MKTKTTKILSVILLALFVYTNNASAYWIWTPQSKKFVNPKYAVKDSPEEQFEWAMTLYNSKEYKKAASEFEKLVKHYEFSELAPTSQYYAGLCNESMGKYYIAFQNYQKTIDNFAHVKNMDEIIARQFNIANIYAQKSSPRIMGTDIMTSLDRSIEIYKKVVDNAPFGRLADEALFREGQVLKKSERYDEAMEAFQKLSDNYPNSKYYDKAKYEVADCAYKASLKPEYDVGSTDKAIRSFKEFADANKDSDLGREADKTIQRLKDKVAEKAFLTAQFYEKQKHYQAAIVYYEEVVDKHPGSSFTDLARAKIEELSKKVKKTE